MILKVRKSNDPILRQPVEKVTDFGHEFQFLLDNMIETMRKNNGVGLAAPQIGISKAFFIVEFEGDEEINAKPFPLTIVVNPEITKYSKEKRRMVEGCLSFPGLELLVKRPEKITIKGQDRHGKPIEIECDDLFSRVLQHENDHLNCTLLIDKMEELNIIFIGTGTLGLESLKALANDMQYKILAVVTGEPKTIQKHGAKSEDNPVKKMAQKLKLPIIETGNIKDPAIIEKLKKLKPDLGIMADFGQIAPKEILDIPTHGIINIHPSLLPKYRGPSPIQEPILNGDKLTGVSLILTSEKMDAGDIISFVRVEVTEGETSSTIKKFLGEVAASLLLNSIPYYLSGDLKAEKQNESQATYTKLFTANDGFVDKNTKATEVERKIRAFDVWPKVYTIVNEKRVRLISAHFDKDGLFIIDMVKPEGKTEMSYEDWKRGHKSEIMFK